jgi:NAD(P)-dependent dehydrogenase (short-subunit alcohol dehydrogenase family)
VGRGGIAQAFGADIFEAGECENLVESVSTELGAIDALVVNPGAGWNPAPASTLAPQAGMDDASKELSPIFNLVPLVLPGMIERRWGRIVALTLLPPYDSPAYSYNAAKAARASTMQLLARDTWGQGVTVNTIGPGPVEAVDTLETAVELADHGDAWSKRTNVTPQDVAEVASFLCSEAGRFVTGCSVPVQFNA